MACSTWLASTSCYCSTDMMEAEELQLLLRPSEQLVHQKHQCPWTSRAPRIQVALSAKFGKWNQNSACFVKTNGRTRGMDLRLPCQRNQNLRNVASHRIPMLVNWYWKIVVQVFLLQFAVLSYSVEAAPAALSQPHPGLWTLGLLGSRLLKISGGLQLGYQPNELVHHNLDKTKLCLQRRIWKLVFPTDI